MDTIFALLEYLKTLYITSEEKDILLVTALSVFVYTFFTYKLWKATKRQTDPLHTPYLKLRFSREDTSLYVKNVGHDIATKIQIEGEKLLLTDLEKSLELRFDMIEILEPGEEKIVPFRVFEDNKTSNDRFGIYFFTRAATTSTSPFRVRNRRSRNFRISFNNIFEQKYYYKTYLEEGEYRIKKFGKDNLLRLLGHKIFLFLQGLKVRTEVWWKRRKHERVR
ncbi:MAG TPA: hypothetical protein VJM57_02515 [Thermodesulfobacteriota bacterium]|nr:hypothetical protein [Thermodesulfobacteriota bacterium]